MRFGAHLSIAKGLPTLVDSAESYGMDAVQAFARNPRGRGETKIPADDAKRFRDELADRKWEFFIHAPYYVNAGSGTKRNQEIAIEVGVADLEKGDLLGARGVIVHMGSRGDAETIEECTEHTIRTVTKLLKKTKAKTRLLLETSAGKNRVGSSFGQLREILDGIGQPDRVGVCFDTCHVFVTGYDVRGAGMKKVLEEFDKSVGLKRLDVVHCNDTQAKIGSGWDKHWHIGQGEVGETGFRHLLRDKRLKDLSFILETPKKDKSPGMKQDPDAVNTATLKRLAGIA